MNLFVTLSSRISSVIQYPADFRLSKEQAIKYGGFLLAAALIAGAQFHHIQKSYDYNFPRHITATHGVIEGLPQWGIHQIRLIGPYMIEGLNNLTGWGFDASYRVVFFLLLLTFFFVLLLISRSLLKSSMAALGTAMAAGFLNAFLMQGVWLYPWDIIDLILFSILIWAILTRKPLWFICLLIVIEIFNHQLVLALAGWLALDAAFRFKLNYKRLPTIYKSFRMRQFIAGITLLLTAYFITEWVRDSLLIAETIRESTEVLLEERGMHAWHFHGELIMFPINLEMLKVTFLSEPELDWWTNNFFGSNNLIIFTPIILGIPFLIILGFFSRNVAIRSISLLYLILWVELFVLGTIYETRIWLTHVPFLVLVVPFIFTTTLGRCETLSSSVSFPQKREFRGEKHNTPLSPLSKGDRIPASPIKLRTGLAGMRYHIK